MGIHRPQDTFEQHDNPLLLAGLVNEFANRIHEYVRIADLHNGLLRHTYSKTSLSNILLHSAPGRARQRSAGALNTPPPPAAVAPPLSPADTARIADQLANRLRLATRPQLPSQPALPPPAPRPAVSFNVPPPPPGEADAGAAGSSGGVVAGFANLSEIGSSGLPPKIEVGTHLPSFDENSPDGRFRLNCPFCGVDGIYKRAVPTKAYSNIKEYENIHHCRPYPTKDVPRALQPSERIAHFSGRCSELWFALRRHARAHPEDADRLTTPLSDADFYSSLPPRLQTQRR